MQPGEGRTDRGHLSLHAERLPGKPIAIIRRTKASSLDLNTAVMAWLRLGQSLDMKGRRAEAVQAYKQASAIAPESDAGKESRDYMSRPYRRKD